MLGKVVATLNACWVLSSTVLQFGNVFNTCFCNSSVYGRSVERAYNVLMLNRADREQVQWVWIGGISMSLISAVLFVAFVWFHERRTRWKRLLRRMTVC